MTQLAQIRDIQVPGSLSGLKFLSPIGDPFDRSGLTEAIVSRLLLFAIVAAGLFFFAKLVAAGFTYMTSGGDSGKLQSASKSLLNAALGLFIVLTSFFLMQILEVLFGISVL